MVEPGVDPIREELDDYVRAYEEAYARDGHASILEFLPPAVPLRAPVLRELIRVNLEYGWGRGCRALSYYREAFPELLGDEVGLRQNGRTGRRLD